MTPTVKYLKVDRVASTNTYAREHLAEFDTHTVVYTDVQTAGRGWADNKWETEPGKNITFTLVYKPKYIPAARMWCISMCAALGTVQALERFTGIKGFKVKWPNDIYHGDRKLAGMLIENDITGKGVSATAIGIGLNVNQREFSTGAPNPVSLVQITGGEDIDRETLLRAIVSDIMAKLATIDSSVFGFELPERRLCEQCNERLYRNDGEYHEWELPDGTRFTARVTSMASDGALRLLDTTGALREFRFKEVKHVINPQLTI